MPRRGGDPLFSLRAVLLHTAACLCVWGGSGDCGQLERCGIPYAVKYRHHRGPRWSAPGACAREVPTTVHNTTSIRMPMSSVICGRGLGTAWVPVTGGKMRKIWGHATWRSCQKQETGYTHSSMSWTHRHTAVWRNTALREKKKKPNQFYYTNLNYHT